MAKCDRQGRAIMSLASWNNILTEVLPKLKEMLFRRQLAIDESYYISIDFSLLIYLKINIEIIVISPPNGSKVKGRHANYKG